MLEVPLSRGVLCRCGSGASNESIHKNHDVPHLHAPESRLAALRTLGKFTALEDERGAHSPEVNETKKPRVDNLDPHAEAP